MPNEGQHTFIFIKIALHGGIGVTILTYQHAATFPAGAMITPS